MLSAEGASVDDEGLFWRASVRFSGAADGFALADLHFGQIKPS